MVALANSKVQYVDSTAWGNVTAWISNHAYAAGVLITNTANTPALANERVFVSIIAGTSTNGSLPALTTTKGAKTVDNGVTWQECSGQPGVNGDTTNSPVWGASLTVVLGQIIYDSNSGALQICSTAGTTKSGSPPSFSGTAGTTTSDNTVTWTSLGAASNFAAFAAAHKRILNADSANWQTLVPAQIMIGDDHAETQSTAGLTLAGGQGTAAKPNQYLCVSHSASQPATSCTTGASVATTGANALIIRGFGYYYGITFSVAGGGSNAASLGIGNAGASEAKYFDTCTFATASTSALSIPLLGNTGGGVDTDNLITCVGCAFTFSATGQTIKLDACNTNIIGGSIAASGSVPTTLFTLVSEASNQTTIRDCDLSAITGTLLGAFNSNVMATISLENCKLGAAVAMTSGANPGPGGPLFRLHNCDSGSKNYRFYEGSYLATIQQETTTVDNTTTATDGTTQISWNIATTANTAFGQPYVSPEIAQWNDLTAGSHTAIIQIAGSNTLTNGDIWMELEYLGNASFPIASTVSSRVADALTATANVTTSTDSWGGSPAHTQQISVTFSPAMKGPVKARIYVAKPSITVYVNPIITIS